MKNNLEKLVILERAGVTGQYSLYSVSKDEAEISIACAREVLELVEKYW